MHTLTLRDTVVLGTVMTLKPGEYLVENASGSQIMARSDDADMAPLDKLSRPFDETKDWNCKSILIVRTGGFGDLILLTPCLREIKRRWPTCELAVCSMEHYSAILKNLPFVDALVTYPLVKAEAEKYDAWIFLEKAIEQNPRAKEVHMTDLFAEIIGLSDFTDKKPEIQLTDSEKIAVLEMFPRTDGLRRICIQLASQSLVRNYHPAGLEAVMSKLHENGWEIFVMGEPGTIKAKEDDRFRNLTLQRLTLRQSAAVINNADCVLGPDSALIHVAGALGIPAVALYGPFPWKLRTAYCPTTFAIQAHGACSPCFHHVNPSKGNTFPVDGPCQKSQKCDVLAGIKPEAIVAKCEKVAKKFSLMAL